jgi:hypothetical protein
MELKKIQRNNSCLNCNTALDPEKDNFCSQCGQLNNVKKETALGMVRELVSEFLHLDSKVSRSLLPLLLRPGYLTKEYIDGRRVRYFHPVRLFLTLTVILFIISGLQEKNEPRTFKVSANGVSTDTTMQALQSSGITMDTSNRLVTESVKTSRVKGRNNNDADSSDVESLNIGAINVNMDSLRRMIDAGNMDNEAMMDKLGVKKNVFTKIIFSQFVRVQKQGFEKLRDYYSDKLPWMLFALMPVFAFVLYLLYISKKIYFVDHLIHAFHLHSAVFLIMSLAGLIQWLTGWSTNWMLLYIPVYYFISQHSVYGQPWPTSIAKGTLAGIFYLMLGLLALFLVAGIMFLMF